ncbi:MAG: Ldh family oxidoreductase [Thermovirgaceae bacterium]
MIRLRYENLVNFATEVLENIGYSREKAKITSWALVEADARGVPSHGLQRIVDYERYVRQGIFLPDAPTETVYETPLSTVLDGNNGIGMDIALKSMKACLGKASERGVGFCSVRNSNHFGMAGLWAEMAPPQKCIGITMTNTEPFAIVTHGRERLLGTNPIAVAFPATNDGAFLLDMATTTVPHGKIETYARRNLEMPLGWAVDDSGADTTNSAAMSELFKSALPFGGQLMLGGRGEMLGGHKGFGLGLLVELFCSALSGGTWSRHVFSPEKGGAITHFFAALSLDLFGEPEEITSLVQSILDEIRSSEKAEGKNRIYIHGEKERLRRLQSLEEGVPLDEKTWEEMTAYSNRFELALPERSDKKE